ncbi:MAG TPA: AEC family transporter [Woeseiaceae bacterium]|nr:AEC family transporter [Woeseiaceae bacterium]
MPVESLLPILVYFLIGILLRRTGLAGAGEAAFLFRFILYVTLPALVFQAISGATLTRDLVLLPIAGLGVNLVCMTAAIAYARAVSLSTAATGVLILGAAITNGVFVFSFVLMALGPEALAEAILVDLGNAVFVSTFAYSAAAWFGSPQTPSVTSSLFRMLRSPLFIALAAALVCSLAGMRPPDLAARVLTPLGAATIPLTIVALGISFSNVTLRDPLPLRAVLLRMPLGFAAGLFFVWLFGFTGTTATVVLVAAASPIGFSSVTLASVARLDTEKAVAALSISVVFALVTTTVLLWAGQAWL